MIIADIKSFLPRSRKYGIKSFAFEKGLELLANLEYALKDQSENPEAYKRFNEISHHDRHKLLNLHFKYQGNYDGIEISIVYDHKAYQYIIFYRYMNSKVKPSHDITDFIEIKEAEDIVPTIIDEIIDNEKIVIQWKAIEAKAIFD